MNATNFTRCDCQVGRKRLSYETLQRDWRCGICGGRLGLKWSDSDERYPEGWHVECLACGSVDFVRQHEIERQRHNVAEALDNLRQSESLPPELAEALGVKKRETRKPTLFSLCPQEVEI